MAPGTPRTFAFGELLDGAFTLYRRNFVTFFGAAVIPQVPVVIFWLIFPGAAPAVVTLLTPYVIVASFLSMGAVTHAVGEAYADRECTVGEALRRGFQRFLPLVAAGFCAGVLVIGGLVVFVIPGLILLAMFFALAPATVLEDRGPLEALQRSRELSRGGRARILGVLAVAWLITVLPVMAVSALTAIVIGLGGVISEADPGAPGTRLMGVAQAANPVISSLTWPFGLAVTVLLYQDRRARTEAQDLEVAVDQLQPEA